MKPLPRVVAACSAGAVGADDRRGGPASRTGGRQMYHLVASRSSYHNRCCIRQSVDQLNQDVRHTEKIALRGRLEHSCVVAAG
eukprot:scaffold31265_cov34-Prasinocladus_malaysianus.AAC.1